MSKVEDISLWHHGIKGQQWGDRNGPPYPLDEKTHARVVSRGTKQGLDPFTSELILYTSATALVWATSAIIDVVSNKRAKSEIERGSRNAEKYESERENEILDKKSGLYLKNVKTHTFEDDANDMERINPCWGKRQPYSVNCTLCTMSMSLRQKGFDVHAGIDGMNMTKNGGFSFNEMKEFYKPNKGPKMSEVYHGKDGLVSICNAMRNEKKSYGNIDVVWLSGGGHSIFYKNYGDEIRFFDTQVNKSYGEKEFLSKFGNNVYYSDYYRLDNVEYDYDALKRNNLIC